mgnify:CR=1 FL=1
MEELKVGMYVRGGYYQYRGKIGKIIKNYQNELEIAYKNSIVKTTVGDFIDDNYDINGKQYKASKNIIDLIMENDLLEIEYLIRPDEYQVEVLEVIKNYEGRLYVNAFPRKIFIEDFKSYGVEIKSVATKEQFNSIRYEVEI